jgi:hypothetical protein
MRFNEQMAKAGFAAFFIRRVGAAKRSWVCCGRVICTFDSPLSKAMSENNAAGKSENALNILNYFGLIDADGRAMPREVESDGIRSEEKEATK